MDKNIINDILEQAEQLPVVGKSIKSANAVKNVVLAITGFAFQEKNNKEERLRIITDKRYVIGADYIDTILQYYVQRSFSNYLNGKIYKMKDLLHMIEKGKNVVITGSGGSGKSTALRWFLIKANITRFDSIVYLNSRMFLGCETIDTLLETIVQRLQGLERCIVFLDGLDEFNCITGNKNEFDIIMNFFRNTRVIRKSSKSEEAHTVVISTRPEHFGLQEKIIEKRDGDTDYLVCKINPLSPQESIKVCKTIKHLKRIEEDTSASRFYNKYPEENPSDGKLSEEKYLELLFEYIRHNKNSILVEPIFCRYAYQIISDWEERNAENYDILSPVKRVEKCIDALVKWEYHDTHQGRTTDEKNKKLYVNYRKKLFSYLTQIAGQLDENGNIDGVKWNKLKGRLEWNTAFCLLSESIKDSLSFVHTNFKEYFLARWYSSKELEQRDEEFQNKLSKNLSGSFEFARMYVEMVLDLNPNLIQCFEALVSGSSINERNALIEKFTDFAQDRKGLSLCHSSTLTIEELFAYFPQSDILYASIRFSRGLIKEIKKLRRLTIFSLDYLKKFEPRLITKQIIDNFCYIPKTKDRLKVTIMSFGYFGNRRYTQIGAFYRTCEPSTELVKKSLRKADIDESLMNHISLNAMLKITVPNNETLRNVLFKEWQLEEIKNQNEDIYNIERWVNIITELLGSYSNFWCYYNGSSISVYKKTAENGLILRTAFTKDSKSKPEDYAAVYGLYKASVCPYEFMAESSTSNNYKEIKYVFDETHDLNLLYNESVWHSYYHA